MRDAYGKFQAHDIALYAVSYDDRAALAEFATRRQIPYPLLSDLDSRVIRQYDILNTEVSQDDAFLYGIPFPGAYVCDEQGKVVAKFFHDTYKKRDSPETLIDAALGKVLLDADSPQESREQEDIRLTVAVHGGRGTVRQGVLRKLVARFELPAGVHIYGEPVPAGMVAAQVSVAGPPGLVVLPAELPPTHPLHLEVMNVDLHVWSGTVDIVIPFYPVGELVSETRPLVDDKVELGVTVRYQACTDSECLLPKSEQFTLALDLDVVDMPGLSMHRGHGQRESDYDSMPAMRRLIWRKFKQHPSSLPKFLWKSIRLELAARRRKRAS